MLEIPLTQGQVALVCDCHAHLVINQKWYAHYDRDTKSFYVKCKKTRMHRVIVGAKEGEIVDHINQNTLDNRCENLRIVSARENWFNSSSRLLFPRSSKYRGVSWHKRKRRWEARISVNGKQIGLGYFKNELDASLAYEKAFAENM